jgi:2'-5' RNA ligase
MKRHNPAMPSGAESSPRALRLFTALWPDPADRAALAGCQRGWSWPDRVSVVPPERLHLTLHFLGNVPSWRLRGLIDVLRVPCESFSLEFGQAELWPHGIAVLRPLAIPDGLRRLYAALAPRVSGYGLPLDDRPYQPHVTLARRAAGARPPSQGPHWKWRADSGYALVQSLPGGAGYEVLERFGR